MTIADRPRDSRDRWVKSGQTPQPPAPSNPPDLALIDRDGVKYLEKKLTKAVKKTSGWTAFWHLVKMSVNCGICFVIKSQSSTIADAAFLVRNNIQIIQNTAAACQSDPIGCIQGKHFPGFRTGKPTDNLTAMLDLIAWAEGADYNISYTGAKFSDFSRHPAQLYCSAGICSDAAGRYQFLSTTWAPIADALNLTDFSPASQDKAAIELIKRCGGYGAAVRGDVKMFADRCYTQWASLQSSDGKRLDNRQRAHSIAELQAKYDEFRQFKKLIAPLKAMRLTSPMRTARVHPTKGVTRPHNGADYACALGETVRSPIAGTFEQGPPDPQGFGSTWGHVLGGDYRITIGHTRKLLVKDGDRVAAGQPIAHCGSEGASTGPHLHLEIRQGGRLVDPGNYFTPRP